MLNYSVEIRFGVSLRFSFIIIMDSSKFRPFDDGFSLFFFVIPLCFCSSFRARTLSSCVYGTELSCFVRRLEGDVTIRATKKIHPKNEVRKDADECIENLFLFTFTMAMAMETGDR